MPSRRILPGLVAFSVWLATASAYANWGHWRGEGGNGLSTQATPPTEWSDTQNVKWKVAIPGRGSSSPVIWGDKVFVTTAMADNGATDTNTQSRQPLRYVLMCIDRETGKTLWEKTATTGRPHEGTHHTNSFASASPCTDGEHVYAHFGSQGLFCYTMDGQKVWQRDFGDMRTRNGFGEGSSPTIAGDKILVPWDHEGPSYLFALDKLSGDFRWRAERDEPTCWATPLVIEHEGVKQVVMNGQNCARAYDLETGKELWRCGGQTQRPAASAVAADGRVFIASGHRGSFLGAFTPGGTGDIEGTDSVLWTVSRDTPDIASPLLSDGRLYYYKGKTGVLTCVDAATGRPHYTTQRTGLRSIYASPVAAGGYVFLTDRDGTTVVIKDADEYQVVAENSVGETVDATPAPVDNQLFIRGEQHLFCIEE
ncbi:PQQ-binding-like beta-propeller repeat protein [Aeoliella sp. ICT_H6.2]|uniref:PQQ-binding-like beta-propeller repeat protein n=1 Tax=Aeoliella straminimaris TaxID=2954799 RepID=A0A9X2FGJ1_9BACT|nr:PQQ-binding-like beta-propeller repeat protein [Aeoliella straminimaris]MCO6047988.1 PQQ-binding-like beta-propeller repeat protein [Aeoliella straminimaris]